MYIGVARLSVAIGQAHSLKEKRMVLRRIKDRVRERLGVMVNEVGDQNVWQRAELGVAVTSGDRGKAAASLDEVVQVVSEAAIAGDAVVVGVAREITKFDAALTPIALVDDRTGAGDKAGAADDEWIPVVWKDNLDE